MDLQFPKLENKILRFWKEDKIFEKSIKLRSRARDFVFYEGPPTANAKPGIHHVLVRAYKDVICRYKTMQGFRVLRKAGWDTHGLPVELEIEKKLGLRSKKDIEKYGIARFNKQCRKSVWQYRQEWEKLTERIGFWLDMKNPYVTYDRSYMETLWWIIKQIWQKGLLYQDYKVVPYCPRCGTSLSSHEVALGYKTIQEPAIYVKFKLKNVSGFKFQDASLLVWTTTPWTLPGNVAVAVNPKLTYVAAQKNGEFVILAKDRMAVLGGDAEILAELKGSDLLGLEYGPLYEADLKEKAYFVIAGDFVSATDGSGLVHIAPAFGEEDMAVGRKNNLPVLMTVDENGRFKPDIKQWAGMFVKEADPLIVKDLQDRNVLLQEELYTHDYPFCWRCSSPLLYYAKESWFIRTTDVKEKLINSNQKVNWIPAYLKEGRFGEWLKDVKDWAFSRERYWGTPLPVWQCQDCGHKDVVGSVADLLSKSSSRNRYFFMRHGHSLRQIKNVAVCWPEKMHCPLTKKGQRDAAVSAKKLKQHNIDLIFSSDLLRTKQTASIVAKETGAKVVLDKRLREYNVGIFNSQDPWKSWDYLRTKGDVFYAKLPKGESICQIAARMYDFLQDMNIKYQGKNIIVVSHELPLTLLEQIMQGKALENILEWRRVNKEKRIGPAEFRGVKFRSLPFNDKMELDLHRPYIDKVVFACPACKANANMERVQEVVDVWFDSGAMPLAQTRWPFAQTPVKNKKLSPPELFPADYISEAVDQTRGWFYTLLAVSTLLGFGSPYKNVVSLGHILDEKGEKMSKSKGNTVDPAKIIDRYGVDALRWYFFTVNQPGEPKLFAEKDVDLALKKFVLTFWNIYIFWKTYNNGRKIASGPPLYLKSENILDKWIIAKMHVLISGVTEKMDVFDITGAARAIESFTLDDLSLWYIRRSRRRFQHPRNVKELQEASAAFCWILSQLSRLCAPFIPFLSEYIYREVGGRRASVHLEDWPKTKIARATKTELEEGMVSAREVVAKALAERARAGIKVRQPLAKLTITEKNLAKQKELLELIQEEVNVRVVDFGEQFLLDTTITPELKEQGILREIIRYVQDLRKKNNLKPYHGILIFYKGTGPLEEIIEKNKGAILAETKAISLAVKDTADIAGSLELQFEEGKLHLGIKKSSKGRKCKR